MDTTALILPPDAPHAEWIAARRDGIGGSDVAAILGISRHAGPTRVFYDKHGLIDDEDNEAMEWGRRLEEPVRRKFADQHPELDVRLGPGLVAHPDRPWQRATIDGLVAESRDDPPSALLEVKTGRSGYANDEWGDELTDEVPLPYVCQVIWYLDIYGLKRGYLAVLLDGRDYREYIIEYDEALAAKLRGHCEAFWRNHVLAGIAPEADALTDTTDVLASQHRPVKDSAGELPAEAEGWAQIYNAAHDDLCAAQKRKTEAGNHLRAAFIAAGSPQRGTVKGRKIASWSLVGGDTKELFELAAFKADHPELATKYTTVKQVEPTRRLTVEKGR